MKTKRQKRQYKSVILAAKMFTVMISISLLVGISVFALKDETAASKLDTKSDKIAMLSKPMKSSVTTSITNGASVTKAIIDKQNVSMAKKSPTNSVISAAAASAAKPIYVAPPAGVSLYVDPSLRNQGRPEAIAGRPSAIWFGGWNSNIQADVANVVRNAAASGSVATLVAYNIPARDCGSYSAGGANSSNAYRTWIDGFANGIGSNQAIVILEPDALPGIDCLSSAGQTQRLADISYAVSRLATTGSKTYLDAGNYSWQSASTMAPRLKAANVGQARGFSLNVSGYGWTNQSISYGQQLAGILGGNKGFVIDTSRNGNGPASGNEWCNPRGRALGKSPTTTTGITSLDAYLWVKVPGESDGSCNGGPSAGQWWSEMADELIANAKL